MDWCLGVLSIQWFMSVILWLQFYHVWYHVIVTGNRTLGLFSLDDFVFSFGVSQCSVWADIFYFQLFLSLTAYLHFVCFWVWVYRGYFSILL